MPAGAVGNLDLELPAPALDQGAETSELRVVIVEIGSGQMVDASEHVYQDWAIEAGILLSGQIAETFEPIPGGERCHVDEVTSSRPVEKRQWLAGGEFFPADRLSSARFSGNRAPSARC